MSANSKPQAKGVDFGRYHLTQFVTFPAYVIRNLIPHDPHRIHTVDMRKNIDNLWGDIVAWVDQFLDPIIDSDNLQSRVFNDIRNHKTIVKPFYQFLKEHSDFKRAIRYPDTDNNVLTAIVIRFLVEDIFKEEALVKNIKMCHLLQELETAASKNQGKGYRDLGIQLWRYNTYTALHTNPRYLKAWGKYEAKLRTNYRQILGCFRAAPHFESSMNKFETTILARAIKIQRDMAISLDNYSFHLEAYEKSSGRTARVDRLVSNMRNRIQYEDDSLDDIFRNVVRYGKRCKVKDIGRAELDENLEPLCSIKPHLQFVRLRKNTEEGPNEAEFGEIEDLMISETLVAYGSDAERRKFRQARSSLLGQISKLAG